MRLATVSKHGNHVFKGEEICFVLPLQRFFVPIKKHAIIL